MTDFVTRLETELHAAALRQERRGRVGAVTMPRLRIAVGALPTAALATALLGLAIAVSALILSPSPRHGAAGELPPTLRGVWRAQPTELRLYDAGSTRCVNLGLGSSAPCYTLGDSGTRVATEWGGVALAGDTLTLHGRQGAAGTGIYRWRIETGTLRLTKVSDRNRDRVRALVAMPLTFVQSPNRHPGVPAAWAAQSVTSERFGYSLRVPHYWSIDTRGPADRLSGDATRQALPEVSVTAQRLRAGTSAARWGVIVDSISESSGCAPHDFRRFFVGGMKVRVSVYRNCGAPHLQSASFVHNGRGYRITWRGKAKRPESDYARFDALVKTLTFSQRGPG
jgi:hypothetical protein